MNEDDLTYMKRALELAARGKGLVSPNPMVGAVLVKDGEIIGEGFHRYDKLKHAESYAIAMAGVRAAGSTLYCTLEPCSHQGRTPPCTTGLIEAGISRAVIAMIDPDERVNGRGIDRMRAAGIEVEVGLCELEASLLNEFYLKLVTRGKPFVHALLIGETKDAREWEPSESLLRKASEYDAVILGSDPRVNRIFVSYALNRERHRPLILAGDRAALEAGHLEGLQESVILELPIAGGRETALDNRGPDSITILERIARLRANSVLVLPGRLSPRDPDDFEIVDKVTALTSFGSDGPGEESTINLFADYLTLEGRMVERAGDHSEISGYLRLAGSAQKL